LEAKDKGGKTTQNTPGQEDETNAICKSILVTNESQDDQRNSESERSINRNGNYNLRVVSLTQPIQERNSF